MRSANRSTRSGSANSATNFGDKKIGIALGAGSARGIAHIGVLQALREMGIEPHIICGCSIGALVGASYVTNQLDELGAWVSALGTREILRYLGIRPLARGGVAEADVLIEHLRSNYGNPDIRTLRQPFAAIATDLHSGREVWLQDGSLWDAVRASIAIPGMITPVYESGRWLVDGALVNPVPVSVCRALGADLVIAVNPSTLMRRSTAQLQLTAEDEDMIDQDEDSEVVSAGLLNRLGSALRGATTPIRQLVSNYQEQWSERQERPATLEVMQGAITIMQDRITRSRLAGEPPDVILLPHVNHIGLLEYHRAAEAIAAGRTCVEINAATIRHALELPSTSP
ncbi:MAG: patatin-like phospholipase family protein [Spongiibacteraceae bacterium]